jgi:hypothetical protein
MVTVSSTCWQGGRQVAEAAFGCQQVLVAQAVSSVLITGSEVAMRYLPSKPGLGLDLRRVGSGRAGRSLDFTFRV